MRLPVPDESPLPESSDGIFGEFIISVRQLKSHPLTTTRISFGNPTSAKMRAHKKMPLENYIDLTAVLAHVQ